jgi:hypothetical protein
MFIHHNFPFQSPAGFWQDNGKILTRSRGLLQTSQLSDLFIFFLFSIFLLRPSLVVQGFPASVENNGENDNKMKTLYLQEIQQFL